MGQHGTCEGLSLSHLRSNADGTSDTSVCQTLHIREVVAHTLAFDDFDLHNYADFFDLAALA